MQGTRQTKPLSSSSSAPPPSLRSPPSIGLGLGLGLGLGSGSGSGSSGPSRPTMTANTEKGGARKKLPTPKELVAHYESQGMQPEEASLKVIDDLQNLLVKVVSNSKKSNNQEPINSRLLRLESKLDSKPGYPQSLAIGVVSGAVFHVVPQVAASVVHIWNSVRAASSSSPSS